MTTQNTPRSLPASTQNTSLATRSAMPSAPAARTAPEVDVGGEDPLEELRRLKAENEALKARAASGGNDSLDVTIRASETGLVSVYGIQRFPLTLSMEQWARLIKGVKSGEVEAAIAQLDAAGLLSHGKEDPKFAAARVASKARSEAYKNGDRSAKAAKVGPSIVIKTR